jgi:hypothetical protein
MQLTSALAVAARTPSSPPFGRQASRDFATDNRRIQIIEGRNLNPQRPAEANCADLAGLAGHIRVEQERVQLVGLVVEVDGSLAVGRIEFHLRCQIRL